MAIGAVLLIGAVAGFVTVPEHKQVPTGFGTSTYDPNGGWSRALHDGLWITTWALLILGVLLVAVGLINHARR